MKVYVTRRMGRRLKRRYNGGSECTSILFDTGRGGTVIHVGWLWRWRHDWGNYHSMSGVAEPWVWHRWGPLHIDVKHASPDFRAADEQARIDYLRAPVVEAQKRSEEKGSSDA